MGGVDKDEKITETEYLKKTHWVLESGARPHGSARLPKVFVLDDLCMRYICT